MGDAAQPSAFRILALQMLRPDHPALAAANLEKAAGKRRRGPAADRRCGPWRSRGDKDAQGVLLKLAKDGGAEPAPRTDAVLGLADRPLRPTRNSFFFPCLDQAELRRALRSLRPAAHPTGVETDCSLGGTRRA